VFDKKRKREGKEEEKKRLIKKTNLSSSLPHLFPLFSHLHLVLLLEKREFSNSLNNFLNNYIIKKYDIILYKVSGTQ
jgi:hypothetical protein